MSLGRDGVAVLVVVFLLFAIGVAAAAAYQVVRGEMELSGYAVDQADALASAEAGLGGYLGRHFGGAPGDTTILLRPQGGGLTQAEAIVTSRRVASPDLWNELYLVESRGRVVHPRIFDFPAVRTVRRYALLRRPPFHVGAALTTRSGSVTANPATVSGTDLGAGCPPAGENVVPVASACGAGACPVLPPGSLNLGSVSAVEEFLDMLPLEVLADPRTPVDYHDSWPNFTLLPPGEYPVIRRTGDFMLPPATGGRGFLIVTGELSFPPGFAEWNGIIVAGSVQDLPEELVPPRVMTIRGALVSWDAEPLNLATLSLQYHSCHVWEASRSAGYLRPLPAGWWMGF